VQSLDLSNNGLEGIHVSALRHYLPRLVNLSLQNNKLNDRDLHLLAGGQTSASKFLALKELILVGNQARDGLSDETAVAKYRR
jgi:hypothetical protein